MFDSTLNWDVYMSGALSALSKEDYEYVTKKIYERAETVCKQIGLTCYLPHKSSTTPTRGMPHSKVWEIDYKRVVNSKVVIAYIGKPSLGVGAEIEMARTANVPVILLFEIDQQEGLSRLILGNPAIKYTIPFNDPKEIEEQLKNYLILIFSEKNLDTLAFGQNWSFPKRQELRKQLVTMEQQLQKGMKFRNFPREPISAEKWLELGNEWDTKDGNKRKSKSSLDGFF